jgi:serine protease
VEPPATRPGRRAISILRHRKPLPEALVAPFRQTPQQRERSRLDPETFPISPTDHGVLIVELGNRTLWDTEPAKAYAAGYTLADELGLRTAEPDLPTPFFPEEDPPSGGDLVAEKIRFPPGCWVDGEPALADRWALDRVRAPEAWAFSRQQGRPDRGRGIVIAQPDTGVVRHRELADVVRFREYDILSRDNDPTDPLDGRNPGHGTGTGSVVVSREGRRVVGTAPAAMHMPIRAITSVVMTTQVSVAEAIGYAVDNGADVITMSLGGVPAAVLERAVRRAVAADVIVLAAAGNCVRSVVWPARYDECIAVGGTNAADRMWRGSCRGSAVDIAAPGQNVLKANASADGVGQGQGTSFAVAVTAGVAALWLAHHGRADLIAAARARSETLQTMFRRLVRATARRPRGWNSLDLGAGIVDARALLAADLDLDRDRESVLPPDPVAEPGFTVAGLVAETVAPEAVDSAFDWHRYGPELALALLTARLAGSPEDDGTGVSPETPAPQAPAPDVAVSPALAGAVANPRLRDELGLDRDLDAEVAGSVEGSRS